MSRVCRRRTRLPAATALLLAAGVPLFVPEAAGGQNLARRIQAAETDPVVFSFPARPGACGAGDAILLRDASGSTTFLSGRGSGEHWRAWRDGEPPCEVGDVVVEAVRRGGRLTEVDVGIGTRAPAGSTLGRVSAPEAVDYLLRAAREADPREADDLILAAALADAERWPGLLALARDRDLPKRTRRSALHWLGREAAAEAARELGGMVRDRTEEDEVREAAVFAISQLPDDQAIEMLIDVVRSVPDARVRSRALFWLADFDDPRAVALFEEILTRG